MTMTNLETIVISAIILLALFVILPPILKNNNAQSCSKHNSESSSEPEYDSYSDMNEGFNAMNEGFTAEQQMQTDYVSNVNNTNGNYYDMVNGTNPFDNMDGGLTPKGANKNYESLIYDNVTRTIMTGSQFMENTGIIAPPWVAPAWNPDAYGPSSKGTMNPTDYEDDPRMLYNKCSLSCCSPQYPTPFQGDSDPFVCDKNGNNKYLASNYICQNNTGGTGCLCMSPKQVSGMSNGFVDYYVDKENLGY